MKAILVIDMPKNCGECKLYINNGNSYWCSATGIDTTGFTIPASCPLRPMPKEKEDLYYPCNEYEQAFNEGYNRCIDEILGEEE